MITLPILRDIVERLPHIDRFVEFSGYPGLAEQFFDAYRANNFFSRMQEEDFDLAVQMHGSGVYSNPFMLMLGAKAAAGFVRPGDPPGLLDAALPIPGEGHEVHRVLTLSTFLGVPPQGEETEFPLWPEDHAAAGELLGAAEPPLIGLHPAARDLTRRWSPERFAAAGAKLRRGGTLVLLGGPEERRLAERVGAESGASYLNLAGKTPLVTLGAVISRLSVLLTNDSGPAHIAYALSTPTVTVFGGGSLERYGPPRDGPYRALVHEVPCRPCTYAECPIGYKCLRNITVQQVVEAAGQVIGGNSQTAPVQ